MAQGLGFRVVLQDLFFGGVDVAERRHNTEAIITGTDGRNHSNLSPVTARVHKSRFVFVVSFNPCTSCKIFPLMS